MGNSYSVSSRRSRAERAFAPPRALVEEAGGMASLAVRTIVSAVRPPHPYGAELVAQFGFALRLCWLPFTVSVLAFSYGVLGIQVGKISEVFGNVDRLGSFVGLFGGREVAPLVTAIVVGGVAGTAMCADLGARRIRSELDALGVLGVDLVKNVVVPRFLALALLTPLLGGLAQHLCAVGGALATLSFGEPLGPFGYTLLNSSPGPLGLWVGAVKGAVFGGIVAVVACYKGMTASGGPEGIGRAVNQAVVTAAILLFAFNHVFTFVVLASTPTLDVVK